MLIPSFSFIWRQLNGPQITGIFKALFEWTKEQFDYTLDYFWNFSVDRAKDEHLTLIGTLIQFARPLLNLRDKNYFTDTSGVIPESDFGFDTGLLTPRTILSEDSIIVEIPENIYRNMLKSFINTRADYLSLIMLDEIFNGLRKQFAVDPDQEYTFRWCTGDETNRKPGDLEVYLGTGWNNILTLRASLDGLIQNVFSPEPVIFPTFSEQE